MEEHCIIEILKAFAIDFNMEDLKKVVDKKPINGSHKCICFSRVSTELQDLTQQNDELYAEAHRNGYSDDNIITIEQKESGVKLSEDQRIGIQRLKEVIEKEPIDCVIIYEISRLARRPTVLYSIRDYLADKGVNLICIKPYMKLLDENGMMSQTASIVFAIFGTMAEQEAILSKQRMRRGMIAKRDRLGYIGGHILLGYKVKDDKIVIDEENAELVRDIFKKYVSGQSMLSIARDLTDNGDLKYSSVESASTMVRYMLHRSEYAGIKRDKYDYPAIISMDLWEQACKTRDSRRTSKPKTKTKIAYFGRGIVVDEKYGYAMVPNPAQNRYTYQNHDDNYSVMYNMNLVESILAWAAQSWWRNKMTGKMDEELEQSAIEWRKRKLTLGKTHADLVKKIDRINERIINGKMDEARGDAMIDTIKEDLKKVESNIIEMEDKVNTIMEQRIRILNGNASDIYSMPDEDAAKFVHECVDKMMISKGKKRGESGMRIIYKDGTETALYVARRGNYFDIIQNGTKLDIRMLERTARKKRLR